VTQDYIAHHRELVERAHALGTGAHPTIITQGGYGRNRHWRKLAVAPSQLTQAASPAPRGLYRCVRGDVVFIKTDGPPWTINWQDQAANLVGYPRRLFQVGRTAYPTTRKTFLTVTTDGYPVTLAVSVKGMVTIEGKARGISLTGKFLYLSGSWPLG